MANTRTAPFDMAAVRVVNHKAASSLIDALGQWKAPWSEEGRGFGDWIFRGVDRADHGLVPSALRRRRPVLLAEKNRLRGPPEKPAELPRKEWLALMHFLEAADRNGHAIPHDSPLLRASLSGYRAVFEPTYRARLDEHTLKYWPPDEMLGVVALAQHYGWSRSRKGAVDRSRRARSSREITRGVSRRRARDCTAHRAIVVPRFLLIGSTSDPGQVSGDSASARKAMTFRANLGRSTKWAGQRARFVASLLPAASLAQARAVLSDSTSEAPRKSA